MHWAIEIEDAAGTGFAWCATNDVSVAQWTYNTTTCTMPAGAVTIRFYAQIYAAPGAAVARFDDGFVQAGATYLHTDHLGSTRVCTDASGVSTGACDYEPFGEVQPGTSCSVPTAFRFAGMRFDSDTGLYHTPFRQYDPNQARWMGVDAIPAPNRYEYVLSDPVNWTDPSGLFPIYVEIKPSIGDIAIWSRTPPTFPTYDPLGNPFWYCGMLPCDSSMALTPPFLDPATAAQAVAPGQWDERVSGVFKDCVKEIFGVTQDSFVRAKPGQEGYFTGRPNDGQALAVGTDNSSFTTTALTNIFHGRPVSGVPEVYGLTLDGVFTTAWTQKPSVRSGSGTSWFPSASRRFSPQLNYVGSNLASGDQTISQAHEVGHSLARMLNLATGRGEDKYGRLMEECYHKGILKK